MSAFQFDYETLDECPERLDVQEASRALGVPVRSLNSQEAGDTYAD